MSAYEIKTVSAHSRGGRARHESGHHPVGVVLEIMVLALLLGAVLTGDRLGANAEAMNNGPLRSVAVVAAAPAKWLNHILFIDRGREALRAGALSRLEHAETLARKGGGRAVAASASAEGSATPAAPAKPAFRNLAPTAESPLTVIVSGDSMTEAFGKYLKNELIATGVVQAVHDFRYSSGIARPDFFDWPKHLAQTMAQQDPDVVVMMIGANDGQDIKVDGRFMGFGTSAWAEVYSARVGQAMDVMAVDGRRVYWVGLPIARSEKYASKMKTLNAIYRAEADKRDGVEYIDTWALFANSSGAYSAYLKDASGKSQLMRRDDGIHLTVAGANRLTVHVMTRLRKDYELD